MGKNSRKNRKNKKKAAMKESLDNGLIHEGNPMTQDQAVFVYGTLMSSGANNMFLSGEDSTFIGSAYTTDPKWAMVSFFKFPGVIADKKNHIWGELYICSRLVLDQLDILEANGSLFKREQVAVTLTDDDTPWNAWMYVVLPDRLKHQDNPDTHSQPGVSQYAFSDDNETPVDHWEPATANLTEATPQSQEAPLEENEIEIEIAVDPREPRRFEKRYDRDKGKVYYVAQDDGEVVQTLTLDPPKKKAGGIATTSSSTTSTTKTEPTQASIELPALPVSTRGDNTRRIGERTPLVIGQGGVPEAHMEATRRWSAAVEAAVNDVAGESALADSSGSEDKTSDDLSKYSEGYGFGWD